MNIVYLGTPDFAVPPLKNLIEKSDGFKVIAVVTNKDKPVGRKQVLTPCPVKVFAESKGIKVLSYDKIREEGVLDLKNLSPDIMITCAFGQILSQEILDIPKYGVINIHASLLPKYRGASPIHYAILNGEKETGVTIMKTDIGIDTGDMISYKSTPIYDTETCGELFDRLSLIGADLIVDTLKSIISGSAKYIPQDHSKATLTKMIKKEHAKINWQDSAEKIYNQIRAFNPAPKAFCLFNGEPLKIFSAKVGENSGKPGEIIRNDDILEIACGEGSLVILELQKAGGKAMLCSDFLRGNKLEKGSILE